MSANDLLARVQALSTPAPPKVEHRGRSKRVSEHLTSILKPDKSEPSVLPLAVALVSILRHWLALPVAISLCLWAIAARNILLFGLALVPIGACLSCWQLRRSLWSSGDVKPGVYTLRAGAIRDTLRTLHASFSPTWWLWHGDFQMLLPFVAYKAATVEYTRTWLQAPGEGDRGDADGATPSSDGSTETLALDWAFPLAGHDASQPIAIILHGLNGGSSESFVQDFVAAATRRGWTAVVMTARGMGGTPLTSGAPFHGARTSDVAATVALVAQAAPGVELVGVGYSMGAIVLANYVGVAGTRCPLSAVVSISGCFDTSANAHFPYSEAVWQPWLCMELKANFTTRGPAAEALRSGGRVDLAAASAGSVRSIVDFDRLVPVPHYHFDGVHDYYRHCSLGNLGKLQQVRTPLLALAACDDPVINSDSFAPFVRGLASPGASPFLHFLFTRRGGHVGWCEGWAPWARPWSFMHRSVFGFADAVRAERAEAKETR